ncbi:CagY family CD-EC repeat-containing protein [Helicobacter pylori]|uniref:CagY family CD-EC repeat-containing protein n=1 Tax=Helicobacter pylori TaxID=210 RepID=UPI003BB0F017
MKKRNKNARNYSREAKKLLEEAKESLKAYKDCLSQARNEEERKLVRNCSRLKRENS